MKKIKLNQPMNLLCAIAIIIAIFLTSLSAYSQKACCEFTNKKEKTGCAGVNNTQCVFQLFPDKELKGTSPGKFGCEPIDLGKGKGKECVCAILLGNPKCCDDGKGACVTNPNPCPDLYFKNEKNNVITVTGKCITTGKDDNQKNICKCLYVKP